RPDGPWLADVERTGELGKNQKETRANKGAGQASPPQAGSVLTHQTPATPKVTVQHSARVKNCLVQVFAGKDERGQPQSKTLRVVGSVGERASVLDCASPLALCWVNGNWIGNPETPR